MSSYKEVEGCLIEKSLNGEFDVIAHGCNCFCTMGAGLAPQMVKAFSCHIYTLEDNKYKGSINKLGTIESKDYYLKDNYAYFNEIKKGEPINLTVINAYTQYQPGANLDYEALTLCLRKMNHIFKGKHIGLPQIGAGIAGGDWERIKEIIQQELKDCDVTVVIYNK